MTSDLIEERCPGFTIYSGMLFVDFRAHDLLFRDAFKEERS